ncbi:hypothetical protein GCM10023205_46040 [Yinghuangia aomiensis]|uniref:Uncharacterized protein n=1 Tax=Yinghuangia aomiensis TaxID=676205 RepID=A0ABP9HMW0_9ACTN
MKYAGLVNKRAVAVLQPGEAAVFAVLVKPRAVVKGPVDALVNE